MSLGEFVLTEGQAWFQGLPVRSLQAGLLALVVGLWQFTLRDRVEARVWSLLWGLVPLRLVVDSRWVASVLTEEALPLQAPLLELPQDWMSPGPPGLLWFVAWLAGVVALGALLFLRARRLTRRALHGRRAASRELCRLLAEEARSLGVRREPALFVTSSGPALVGWRVPCILLPSELLPAEQRTCLRAALRHELGHLRRRDVWRSLVWQLVTLVFWFHPAQWWANAQAARLREVSCDRLAAGSHAANRASYRRALVQLAGLRLRSAPGLSFLSPVEGLRQRLAHLAPNRPRWRALPQALLGLATTLLGWGTVTVAPAMLEQEALMGPSPEVLQIMNTPPHELQGCLQLRFATFARAAHLSTSP